MSGRSSNQFFRHRETVFIVRIQELNKEAAKYLPEVRKVYVVVLLSLTTIGFPSMVVDMGRVVEALEGS